MKLARSENRRTVAIAAYQSGMFVGYAVKSREGWIAVGQLGMSWARGKCLGIIDAQTWLRTASHAAKFDWFSEIIDLQKLFATLPDHQQPGITLESLGSGVLPHMRLSSPDAMYFTRL